jgi:hypothetical protein
MLLFSIFSLAAATPDSALCTMLMVAPLAFINAFAYFYENNPSQTL